MKHSSKEPIKKNYLFWTSIVSLLIIAVLVICYLLFRTELESESKENKERKDVIKRAIQKEEHPIYIPGKYYVNFSKRDGYWFASALASDEDLIRLSNKESIEKLRIKNSEITQIGFKSLLKQPVKEISLWRPFISASELIVISKMRSLENLSLRDTKRITDALICSMDGPKSLRTLTLRDTAIGDKTLIHIAKTFPNLKALDLRKCKKITKHGIKSLKALTELKYLNLNNIKLSKEQMDEVAQLKSLKHLCIVECSIDDSKLKSLKGSNLQKLNISENPVTDKSFKTLSKIPLFFLKMNSTPRITKRAATNYKTANPKVQFFWSPKYEADHPPG